MHGRGFTLLEVMISLVVVGLALGAVVVAVGRAAADQDHLRRVTFGRWVALNALTEIRLSETYPAVGSRNGDSEMGPFRYRWRMVVNQTDEPDVRRMDIEVVELDSELRQTMTGFAGQ